MNGDREKSTAIATGAPDLRTQTDNADANGIEAEASSIRDNPLKKAIVTDADGADAKLPAQSDPPDEGIAFATSDAANVAETPPENGIAAAIDAAEDIRDPLEGLVEKAATDPGAPFAPEVLECLAALKKEDRAAFEVLRVQLKKAGCRVTALDEAIAAESGETGGRGPTQADTLIDLAQSAELFHTPDGTGFADLDIIGHRETWPIRQGNRLNRMR